MLTEGRRYPEDTGPGAGCPPEHGLSTAAGINPFTPDGMLADADRDGIDQMVFFPSFGLRAPSIESRSLAVGFAELYNEWIADWCRRGNGTLPRRRGAARSSTSTTPIAHAAPGEGARPGRAR